MALERQEYNEVSPWWGEHVYRYEQVVKYLTGNENILDIACGTGYGSYLLSKHVNGKVYGGDIDSKTIAECKNRFTKDNLEYQIMDGTALPFKDNFFDIVVSFETIEHTKDYEKMLSEFNRTLKPGGKLFLSTPNRLVSSPDGIIKNPFHTQEWNKDELLIIVSSFFKNIEFYGQVFSRYKSNTNLLAEYIEKILYLRGFRKIPIKIQDKIMQLLGKPSIYPKPDEFYLTSNPVAINKASTLFVVCYNE
jgi:ubiquinone/menaquinone biosynthesis C-methylase UbiE